MGWKGVCNQGFVYGIGIWCYMYAYIWTDHFLGMWALLISLWNVFLISLNLSPWKNDFMPPKNNHHPSNRLDLHFYSIMWISIFPDQKKTSRPQNQKKTFQQNWPPSSSHIYLTFARSKQPTCPICLQGWPRTSLIINFLPRCRPGKLPYNFSKRWRWTSIFVSHLGEMGLEKLHTRNPPQKKRSCWSKEDSQYRYSPRLVCMMNLC